MANETNFTIAASPKQMALQTQLLRTSCSSIIKSLDNINQYMEQISCYWETEGAETLKEIFKADTAQALTLRSRLKHRLTDLDSIISNYEAAESTSKQEAMELPDSIFN